MPKSLMVAPTLLMQSARKRYKMTRSLAATQGKKPLE
jgi:hypothetical protein